MEPTELLTKVIPGHKKAIAGNLSPLILQQLWFLPPANEVWGKVMFLHLSLSVILFKGDVFPIACWDTHPARQTLLPRQNPSPQADTPPDTTGYDQQAGGMHPTGMHTCYYILTLQ